MMGRLVAVILSALIVPVAVAAVAWLYLPPHAIVIAAGPTNGAFNKFGRQYAEALGDNVTAVVLPTRGAADNFALLHDPNAKSC
jgi:hypothetical protein